MKTHKTNSKTMEQALRESEQHYRSLVETARDVIFVIRPDGTFESLNPAFERVTGWLVRDWIGQPFAKLIHPDELARATEIFQSIMSGHPMAAYEFRVKAATGEYLQGEFISTPWLQNGHIAGILGIGRDITARKRMESALQESERKYRALVETTNTGFLILDAQGKVVDANPEYVRLSGHDKLEDILGRSVVEWTAPHDLERNAQEVAKCATQGFVRNLEIDYVNRSGQITPIEINAKVVGSGDSARILSLCRDITERKRSEAVQQNNERRFRALVENLSDAIALLGPDGRFLYASPSASRINGALPEDFMGRNAFEVIHPDDRLRVAQNFQQLQQDHGASVSILFRLQHRDGSWRWIDATATNRLADPLIGAIVINYRDITERKQAEEKLRTQDERQKQNLQLYTDLLNTQTAGIYRVRIFAAKTWQKDAWLNSKHAPYSIELVTDRFCNILGITREVFGSNPGILNDLVHPDDKKGFAKAHAEAMANPARFVWTGRLLIDGVIRWVCFESLPRPLENGDVVWTGALQDITERKQAEEALCWSENQLHVTLEATADGILAVDNQGKVIKTNRRFAELWRIPQSLLERHDDQALLSYVLDQLAEPEAFLKHVQALYHTDVVDIDTLAFKDGRFFERYSSPMLMDGRIMGRVWSFRDITERKRAEKTLQESEFRYRRLFEQTGDYIFVLEVGPDGIPFITDMNEAAVRAHGYTREEMLGKSIAFLDPDSTPDVHKKRAESLVAGDMTLFTVQHQRKDGSLFDVEVRACVLRMGTKQVVITAERDITERRRAETVLQQSERNYREIFDAANDAIFIHDADTGAVLDVNDAMLQLYGFSHEEALRLSPNDSSLGVSPYSAVEARQWMAKAVAEGPQVFEWHARKKSGELFWVEVALKSATINGQRRILAVCRDITERKRAANALQQSETRYRTLFESSHDAIMTLFPPDWKFRTANAATLALFGAKDEQEFTTLAPWEVSPERQPDGQLSSEKAIHMITTAMEQGSEFFDWTHQRIGGDVFTATVLLTPVELEGQKGLLATVRDITAQKRAAVECERLAKAVEQAAETIVITDPMGAILYANPAFEKITGYRLQEALGVNPRILKSGKHSVEFYRHMWTMLTAGEVWSGRIVNKRKDGTLYEEEATISPVFDTAGKVINYVAVKRDITREVALEEQYRQAVKMEAVGRLAGGVAHDFNNKLQIILGSVEMILRDLQSEHPCRADILEIQSAAQRSADLTRQLLAFSRQQAITPVLLDVNKAISHSLKMLGRLIGEHIQLRFVQKPDTGRVFMDPGQVDQLLANLAVNARDAIEGTGHITIEAVPYTLQERDCRDKTDFVPPGDYVLLTFRDDGVGMTPEIQARIFEPFFTTKGIGKGTGLGLATVYGIVKQNNGAITVQSALGQGTTFSIYLPRASDVALDNENKAVEYMPTGTETVLLVEDEVSVLQLARRTLGLMGYRVLTASTPLEALRLCENTPGPIHLLLTDVIMPHMNGKALAERIQKLRPGIRVLYMSGYPANIMEEHGHSLSNTAILPKPFSKMALAQRIRAVLDEPSAAQ